MRLFSGIYDPGRTQSAAHHTTIFALQLTGFTGSIEDTALYAGESCALVHNVKPAGQIVRDVMHEAKDALNALRHMA